MEHEKILFVLRLPARLTVRQVAVLLNFNVAAIYHFIEIGLLEAIGERDGVQIYCDAQYVNALRYDAKWLRKGTAAARKLTQTKNAKQKLVKSKKGATLEQSNPHP